MGTLQYGKSFCSLLVTKGPPYASVIIWGSARTASPISTSMIFSISTVHTTSGKPMLNPKLPMRCLQWR